MTDDPEPVPAPDPADDTPEVPAEVSGVPGVVPREDGAAAPAVASGTRPAAWTQPSAMLASTADRERAIDVLKAGFAEGRLTQDEHDERVTRAHAARTYGDLASIVSDLPAGPLGGAVASYPSPPAPAPPAINSLAVASLICGLVEIPTLGLSAVPAVVLGSRARQQIRQTGQRGEGLAVAGLVLGWAALALFIVTVAGMMIWMVLPPGPGTGGPIGG